MNEHPSPEFEKELREMLRTPQANPVFVRDLRATLIERSTMKTQTRSFPRLAWALVLAILLIGLLIASPQVVQALKRLLGYVPGLGYVEQGSSLRMLVAPVTLEKNGLKLTIEKGAADPQRTVLLGRIDGYTQKHDNTQYCDTPPGLVLPNGKTLTLMQSETTMKGNKGSPTGSYYVRYVFESMPEGQLQATLEIPCLMQDPVLSGWTLSLQFQTANDTSVMPVIELPTPASENVPPPTDLLTAPTSAAGATLQGLSILLESETPLEDGYILSGSYQWTDPRFEVFDVQILDPKITDANGGAVDFETAEPHTSVDPGIKKLPFAYQIHGKNYAWPLTIAVNSVTVNVPEEALFQFDAGSDPQVGQTWDVNIDVPLAGHIVHVQNIQLTAGRTPTELGFTFTLTSDPEVMGVSVTDANPVINGSGGGSGGGGGGGGGGDNAQAVGSITYGWALEGYSPAGVKTFVVSNLAVMAHGNWQVTWQPSHK